MPTSDDRVQSEAGTHHDRIITGDAFDVLDELPEESVHAIVTDPPYGLNFMPDVTNGWDDFEPKEYQEWCEEWSKRAKRVLKPGGHLLAFSGNRTHHRLFTGVEDAGFEIRDALTYHYGSGFPKGADVSKTIDNRADAEREVVGTKDSYREPQTTDMGWDCENRAKYETAPATDAAKTWDGWKTGLKPATEFIAVARKPFDGAAVDCVLEHGTAALNINGCRVGAGVDTTRSNSGSIGDGTKQSESASDGGFESGSECDGRYPANVVFDDVAAQMLDDQTGDLKPPGGPAKGGVEAEFGYNGYDGDWGQGQVYPDDSGGASRFFYTSKASAAERTLNGRIDNTHPTVKPLDLMEWLVKLVTAEGQLVLDPFCGTGTTCKAAKDLGRRFIGIEEQKRWADVARVRCGLSPDDPSHVRPDDVQSGFEAFAGGGSGE